MAPCVELLLGILIGCGNGGAAPSAEILEDPPVGLLCDGTRELDGAVIDGTCIVPGPITQRCGAETWVTADICADGSESTDLCIGAENQPYLRLMESWESSGDAAGGSVRLFREDGRLVYIFEWVAGFGGRWSCDGEEVFEYQAGTNLDVECFPDATAPVCG